MGTVNLALPCNYLLTPQPNYTQLPPTSTMKVFVSLLLIAVVASVSYAGVPSERTRSFHHQNASSLVSTSGVGACDLQTNCAGGTCCDAHHCCKNHFHATCCKN